jgi:hypothetical protein
VGCGGGDGGSSSSVEDVRACIEEAGLPVEAPQGVGGEEIGVEDTLKVTLTGNKEEGRPNGIVITFFESEEDAAEYADSDQTFLEGAGAGGSAEQHGTVVVSVARSGNEKEFEQVQDCV